jgi:hypothetical protein
MEKSLHKISIKIKPFSHHIIRIAIAYLLLAYTANEVNAQSEADSIGNCSIYISSQTGFGYGKYKDEGVSPLIYQGLVASQGFSIATDIKKTRLIADAIAFGGLYKKSFFTDVYDPINEKPIINKYNSAGIDADIKITSLYQLLQSEKRHFRFYLGGSIEEYLDLKINSNFENAAVGVGNFLNLNADFLGEYDFSFTNNMIETQNRRFTASLRISIPITSLIIRPGFSYLINANGNTINYVAFCKMLSGIDTKTSLSFKLKNENQIRASYCWTYITTGKHSIHRFDDAKHMFIISFHFKLL